MLASSLRPSTQWRKLSPRPSRLVVGRQNLSFFAFTATPKARTLEMFGTWNQRRTAGTSRSTCTPCARRSKRASSSTSSRNYTTYETYWRIEKSITEDPKYESAKARRAIARFVSLHPSNLSQKAEIIVEHFRAHTAAKIGGKAKAMVVTSSRLHAVRYWQAITKYIKEKGYTDVAALVAFSGRVVDKGLDFTEYSLNGFPESQTAEKFASDDYQVLVVAEKFQTGLTSPSSTLCSWTRC